MSDNNRNNNEKQLNEENQLDFFKFMDETIRKESIKSSIKFDNNLTHSSLNGVQKNQQENLNKEYYRRYGSTFQDRMWIGKRRY